MRKTILAFASVFVMLAAGMVLVGVSDDSDAADSIPAPEKLGLEGYPITVFKQDGSKQGYTNLNQISMESGDEIWVYDDITEVETISITDGLSIILHLHHSTMEFILDNHFTINGGSLTVEGTGVLTEKKGYFDYAPIVMKGSAGISDYSIVNIGSEIELRGWSGLFVTHNGDINNSGVKIDFAGKAVSGKDVAGDNGHGMYVNGTIKKVAIGDPNTILTPYVPEITIRPGSVIDGGLGNGIYAAGYVKWNIDGAYISGDTGIEIRAGEMNISNTTIVANGTPLSVTPNGNGSTTNGAGIAVAQHTTKQPISLTIDSSSISGFSALYQSNPQNNGQEFIDLVEIDVNSGSFGLMNDGTVSVYSQNLTGFINGGTFSSEPTASYIASGKTLTSANGKWFVSVPVEETAPGKIETEETIINANLGTSTGTSIDMSSTGVKLDIAGSSGLGNIVVSAEERRFAAAPNAAASFEITIVTSTTYVADITVPAVIPSGFQALAYYIDDNGNLMPVEVVNYTSSTVTFRTTHTTPFVILAEEIVIPEIPGDDEDEYPFPPSHGSNQGTTTTPAEDSSDNKTKIIAAAAAVVIIMLAAVALMTNRNH